MRCCAREYIADDSLDAADRVIADILVSIDALAPFPYQGHRRPDLTSRALRFTVVREYLIAYAPEEGPLWVVAVMHGRAASNGERAAVSAQLATSEVSVP